jgi:hypothetical protein
MMSPKLRRVFALTALMTALSLLPAEAASLVRHPRQASFSARIEHWGALAWGFLTGLWEKRGTAIQPDGQVVSGFSAAGDDSN